jgi:branched-subunit amino acid transport protein
MSTRQQTRKNVPCPNADRKSASLLCRGLIMNLWLIIVCIGVMTLAIRLSFILLLERLAVPDVVQRALRFVPAAVLSAIIVPDLVMQQGTLNVAATNPRLLAGLLAAAIAWRTQNVLLTIAVGMGALWGLQAVLY